MKPIATATLLVVSALTIPLVSLGADEMSDRSHPQAFVKDSVITTKVKSKLAAEHMKTLADIHVDTDDNGIVWLRGNTTSQEDADRAVAIARGTEGVKDVHSDITVQR